MGKKKIGQARQDKKFSKIRKLLGKDPKVKYEEITLKGDLRSEDPPKIICTCGWETEVNSNLLILGRAAKQHEIDNPGHFRRQHASTES